MSLSESVPLSRSCSALALDCFFSFPPSYYSFLPTHTHTLSLSLPLLSLSLSLCLPLPPLSLCLPLPLSLSLFVSHTPTQHKNEDRVTRPLVPHKKPLLRHCKYYPFLLPYLDNIHKYVLCTPGCTPVYLSIHILSRG